MAGRKILIAGLLAMAGMGSIVSAQNAAASDDPFVWLEEIEGEKALAWARSENEKTLGALQKDPRYARFHEQALQIVQAQDRIAVVSFRPDGLYNFWQDKEHVRGILRRTCSLSCQKL
jgi:prolyl oligopeptidase